MKKIMLVLLIVLLTGGYLYYRSLTSGPKYSLLQAKQAVDNHNLTAFDKYVDVESITGNLIDQATEQKSALATLLPGSGVAKAALKAMKPQLTTAVKKEVHRYVETGSFNANGANRPLISLAALAGAIVSEDSEFKGIEYINDGDDVALVGIKFTQPKYDTTLVLEIKMIDKGEYWQATEVTNTAEVLKHVARLEKKRLLKRNQ